MEGLGSRHASRAVKVFINGQAQNQDVETVADLVAALSLQGPTLLIEPNGLALRREEWRQTRLSEGDKLEILRIAAGG